ncbi:pIIIa [Bat mastadenovirus WIV12]|uniref:PIIIa n=1 Tax=Bat mastadenovirus WIV12 TaxID=1788434 RepID=A0A1B0UHZ1_9ADEN|nr:pIIIa [Bat mastadenovirus WIV12]AMB43151.1 pIIIa [Bat mastadenovirus WIV12]
MIKLKKLLVILEKGNLVMMNYYLACVKLSCILLKHVKMIQLTPHFLVNNMQPTRNLMQIHTTEKQEWPQAFKRVLGLTKNSDFARQPKGNRFSTILETFVPSRKNPTYEKVLNIVNALIKCKAIRADEGGEMFNALLQRISKYNSINLQTNLDHLVTDVKEALAQKERKGLRPYMGSLIALNTFLSTLPATVPKGQDIYLAFISALKLLVTEVPQTDVYQAGPNFYLQTSRNGSHTVNLTKAFENLKSLWGVKAPNTSTSSVSSLLTPNTRLLLLLIAPFTNSTDIPRDTYLGHLLTLYRETIGQANLQETTFREITQISEALGDEDVSNLQATLNFLLTNRQANVPVDYSLTVEEERILRYVQQSISMFLQQGFDATDALDQTVANLEPSFYSKNRSFINKLMDYFHRAASMYPTYFTNAVLNPKWLPPEGFYTGDFDFPEVSDGLLWNDFDSSYFGQEQNQKLLSEDVRQGDSSSILDNGSASRHSLLSTPSLLGATAASPVNNNNFYLPNNTNSVDYYSLMKDPSDKNLEKEMETITEKFARWKTYAQEHKEMQDKFNGSGRFHCSIVGNNECW